MKLVLQADLAEEVLTLTTKYGYAPGEIISIGIAMAVVLLREKGLGNRLVVVDQGEQIVGEFQEVQPTAIDQMAAKYLSGIGGQP